MGCAGAHGDWKVEKKDGMEGGRTSRRAVV